jgi:hypothetical protein
MTFTLDLTPAEEARLAEAAQRDLVAPDALLKRLVNHLPLSPHSLPVEQQETAGAREAAIDAAQGSMAYVGARVEDLHRERQADKAREGLLLR